jgi:hypothetical protein
MNFSTSTYISYNLSFLELYPQLECKESGQWNTCEKDDICDGSKLIEGKEFRSDFSSKYTLHNWVEESNLWCTGKFQIGLFGSIIFLGYGVSSFLVNPLSDKYGRRFVLLLATLMHVIF